MKRVNGMEFFAVIVIFASAVIATKVFWPTVVTETKVDKTFDVVPSYKPPTWGAYVNVTDWKPTNWRRVGTEIQLDDGEGNGGRLIVQDWVVEARLEKEQLERERKRKEKDE